MVIFCGYGFQLHGVERCIMEAILNPREMPGLSQSRPSEIPVDGRLIALTNDVAGRRFIRTVDGKNQHLPG